MCFRRTKLQINDIQQVIVQIGDSTSYKINGIPYNAFEIIFKLNNGREVTGCSGVIDKDGESRKAYDIIRNTLSQNIKFGGNLVE